MGDLTMKPELRAPVYGLLVSPEPGMRDDIHRGKQTGTLREGWRDYREGAQVLIACHIAPWAVMATISHVRHCLIEELTPQEYGSAGFRSIGHVLDDLRRFGGRYADLEMDSPITAIRWKDVKGYWVDNAEEYGEIYRMD